jgi:3-oxoacyl-[acyl-carrier-protein] synthase II
MPPSIRDGKLDVGEFVRRAYAVMDPENAINCEPHVPAQCLAALLDAQGPNLNCIAACASSAQAIGNAGEMIRRGEADVMLAGGAHSLIHPLGITGLLRLSVLTLANEKGEKAMRPFDANRNGFVVGEGGAIVALEELEHARARGAEILGELTGYSSGHEAYHLTDTHPGGRALADCVRKALCQAKLNFGDIDYVNAHGTSTRLNDRIETLALKKAFGEAAYRIPISSTKSMLGHSTTACGALELVVALMAVRTGLIPPTINLETRDPECDLDYVPNAAREGRCRHALSDSLGFGGQTAALIVSRFEERSARVSLAHAA